MIICAYLDPDSTAHDASKQWRVTTALPLGRIQWYEAGLSLAGGAVDLMYALDGCTDMQCLDGEPHNIRRVVCVVHLQKLTPCSERNWRQRVRKTMSLVLHKLESVIHSFTRQNIVIALIYSGTLFHRCIKSNAMMQ